MASPFELSAGFLPDELAPLAIGPWSRAPATADGLVSFSTSGTALGFAPGAGPGAGPEATSEVIIDATRWCVNLDEDPAHALAVLDDGDRRLADSQAELDQLPVRLERVLAMASAPRVGEISFSGAPLSSAESRLLADLAAVGGVAGGPGIPDDASGDMAGGRARWRDLAMRARSAIEAILRLITHAAWVETRVRGVTMARTAMSWTGDTRTELTPLVTPGTARLHARSVALAVRSRDAWGRLVAIVMQTSLRLARIMAAPNGLIAAMPLIWELACSALAELDARREPRRG
ncbi:MAG TPA: hypothetical protein VNM90_18205 [Haliangium sp.]|nr:hypothetical protein [Haliangium sp.]